MHPQVQSVAEKLAYLSPERLTEVEDFIDFLRQRDSDQHLRTDYARASESTFAKVWDNDDDATYDQL